MSTLNRWLLGCLAIGLLLPVLSHAATPPPMPDEKGDYLQAIAAFNARDWDTAKRAFINFQTQYPKSTWRLAVDLRLADLETDPNKTLAAYRRVMTLTKVSEWKADARWGLACTHLAMGNFAEAAVLYDEVMLNDLARKPAALYFDATCQFALKNYTKAEEYFTAILRDPNQPPWAPDALIGLADVKLARSEFSIAQGHYQAYLDKYPEGDQVGWAQERQADILEQIGNTKEAKSLQQTLQKDKAERIQPEPTVTPEPVIPAPEGATFTVQVGAFSKKEFAERLQNKLKKKGLNAYLVPGTNSSGVVLSQVRVGNYSNREFALKIAKELEKTENLPYLIMLYTAPEKP